MNSSCNDGSSCCSSCNFISCRDHSLTVFFSPHRSHQPAKVSPQVSEKRNQNTVPDYPPNNRVNAREAVRTINTAAGEELGIMAGRHPSWACVISVVFLSEVIHRSNCGCISKAVFQCTCTQINSHTQSLTRPHFTYAAMEKSAHIKLRVKNLDLCMKVL